MEKQQRKKYNDIIRKSIFKDNTLDLKENETLMIIQNNLMQPILKVFSDACNKVGADQGYDFIFDACTGGLLYSLESHFLIKQCSKFGYYLVSP